MSRTASPSTDMSYGLARVCRVWGIPRSTVYWWRSRGDGAPIGRPGPEGGASDQELVAAIRQVIDTAPFFSEGYRKVWARLRMKGIRTAMRRVRRLMRENNLSAPNRPPRAPEKTHDKTITTEQVDTTWGTDMTETVLSTGQKVRIFATVDHCNSECVGIHGATSGTRWEALEPIRQAVGRFFGPAERDVAKGLTLRHDHGSNYMARDFQREIAFLGIESSPSFVREPEGNGVAERFFRTLKEQLLWVRSFDTVEELLAALRAFKDHYNANWLLQRHGGRTPDQVRAQQANGPLAETPMPVAA